MSPTAPPPVQPLPTSVTAFVGAADSGPLDTAVQITSAADYHATFGPSLDAHRPLGHAVDLFFAGGGTRAVIVRSSGTQPDELVPDTGAAGLRVLDGTDIGLLVLPGLTADHVDQVRIALSWCAAYRAVLLLDLPAGPWTPSTAAALAQVGEHRERAAAYHPWVVTQGTAVPPSGAVAGVIARTDATRGVWKAPAGEELRAVESLTQPMSDREGTVLAEHGVNALRSFPARGHLVWGARTLAGSTTSEPASRYLSVRRLADHVIDSLVAGLTWVSAEQSGPALWASVRASVEDFLHGLWRQGAFSAARPQEAFAVRCGLGETMTESDVRAGQLLVMVAIAPTRPAEFDVHTLRFQTGMPSLRLSPRVARGLRSRSAGVWVRDLSQVQSRYLGETEKNVGRVLDAAEASGGLVQFDEADALFGTRGEEQDETPAPEPHP